MAMNGGLRSKLLSSSVSREFPSSKMRMMGGGHARGRGHDELDRIHPCKTHMYNLDKMKYRQIKMPLFVFSCFAIGALVSVYAVMFQQKKTSSG